ncbi:hypothetical protein D1872_81660 [compost metagenome]
MENGLGTTTMLWEAEDAGLILDAREEILLNSFRRDQDGLFPTEDDWQKFADNVMNFGTWYLAKCLSDVESDKDRVTYRFNSPILAITGFQIAGGQRYDIVSEIHEITFEIWAEWVWLKSDRDFDSAGMLEISGKVVDMK